MPESSLLETTAEVSVAFAGFIGIFLVLATREGTVGGRLFLAVWSVVAIAAILFVGLIYRRVL